MPFNQVLINFEPTLMDDMQTFYRLKQNILAKYREAFPYYTGSIQGFGNREIAQLIDLVEKDCHERVSEKWVYTHLKPETNSKLPRRDMLDIFCKWIGVGSWEEFVFEEKGIRQKAEGKSEYSEYSVAGGQLAEELTPKKTVPTKKARIGLGITMMGSMIAVFSSLFVVMHGDKITVCFKDRYTQKPVDEKQLNVYSFDGKHKQQLKAEAGCYTVKDSDLKLITESAYYRTDTIVLPDDANETVEINLQPDDYAMMVRAYMNGNVADWKKRRQHLGDILSDNAVIQEVMFDDIGVEFLNKQEFIDKVTTPGTVAKNMEVLEIKYDGGKIVALKFMQKGK